FREYLRKPTLRPAPTCCCTCTSRRPSSCDTSPHFERKQAVRKTAVRIPLRFEKSSMTPLESRTSDQNPDSEYKAAPHQNLNRRSNERSIHVATPDITDNHQH